MAKRPMDLDVGGKAVAEQVVTQLPACPAAVGTTTVQLPNGSELYVSVAPQEQQLLTPQSEHISAASTDEFLDGGGNKLLHQPSPPKGKQSFTSLLAEALEPNTPTGSQACQAASSNHNMMQSYDQQQQQQQQKHHHQQLHSTGNRKRRAPEAPATPIPVDTRQYKHLKVQASHVAKLAAAPAAEGFAAAAQTVSRSLLLKNAAMLLFSQQQQQQPQQQQQQQLHSFPPAVRQPGPPASRYKCRSRLSRTTTMLSMVESSCSTTSSNVNNNNISSSSSSSVDVVLQMLEGLMIALPSLAGQLHAAGPTPDYDEVSNRMLRWLSDMRLQQQHQVQGGIAESIMRLLQAVVRGLATAMTNSSSSSSVIWGRSVWSAALMAAIVNLRMSLREVADSAAAAAQAHQHERHMADHIAAIAARAGMVRSQLWLIELAAQQQQQQPGPLIASCDEAVLCIARELGAEVQALFQ